MKIIINVDPCHADGVRDFAAGLNKILTSKVKALPHLELTVYRGNSRELLELHRFKSIAFDGLPEINIEPGDVVREIKTGCWGRVLNVNRNGSMSCKSSRETLKETGNETFVCRAEDVEVLV